MPDIVITIRSEFAEKIYSGEKQFELRKRMPHIGVGTRCWIYEPMPVGMVTGYFNFGGCQRKNKYNLWILLRKRLCIDLERYLRYYDGQQEAYAWKVIDATRIEPRPLFHFGIKHAPQSYQRIKVN